MKKLIICIIMPFILFSAINVSADTISLATTNWEPFFGEELPENGFFAALSREAFKRAGYEMKIRFLPWKRAMVMAEGGQYDGLLGAYHNDQRAEKFHFTDSIFQNDTVFIQKKGRGITYTKIEDLKRYIIGTHRGTGAETELLQKGMNIDSVTDNIMNLKKLYSNRIDLLIMSKPAFYYKIYNIEELKQYKGGFDIIDPPYKRYEIYNAISKNTDGGEKIVSRFNNALRSMKEDGSYDKILDRFKQDH